MYLEKLQEHAKPQAVKNYTCCRIANMHIKTHGSESRGQEEAGLRDERVSYLQVTPL